MTAPVEEVTALRCGTCRNLFENDERGRAMASECCTCPRCGGSDVLYMGARTPCRKCHAEAVLASALLGVEHADATLKAAREAVDKLNAPRPAPAPRKGRRR